MSRIVLRLLGVRAGVGTDCTPDGVVSAAASFAPTSFARARLLRQLHACGLMPAEVGEPARMLDALR